MPVGLPFQKPAADSPAAKVNAARAALEAQIESAVATFEREVGLTVAQLTREKPFTRGLVPPVISIQLSLDW